MREYPPRAKDNFDAPGSQAGFIKIWSTGWAASYPKDFQSRAWITLLAQAHRFPVRGLARLNRLLPIKPNATAKAQCMHAAMIGESGNDVRVVAFAR
ncbi:hypothetical protein [Burkholderia oklahomensis]|uniref:hypothetical protein n=1 Tax=Burkholderia oklahomensis TaxID=342113 RepID=UPI000ACEB74E|nr:hypothetical protein [Burkholderia oklahomensis]MBI0359455.1 hypothetical protein [Burkholderia oklahomensis]